MQGDHVLRQCKKRGECLRARPAGGKYEHTGMPGVEGAQRLVEAKLPRQETPNLPRRLVQKEFADILHDHQPGPAYDDIVISTRLTGQHRYSSTFPFHYLHSPSWQVPDYYT